MTGQRRDVGIAALHPSAPFRDGPHCEIKIEFVPTPRARDAWALRRPQRQHRCRFDDPGGLEASNFRSNAGSSSIVICGYFVALPEGNTTARRSITGIVVFHPRARAYEKIDASHGLTFFAPSGAPRDSVARVNAANSFVVIAVSGRLSKTGSGSLFRYSRTCSAVRFARALARNSNHASAGAPNVLAARSERSIFDWKRYLAGSVSSAITRPRDSGFALGIAPLAATALIGRREIRSIAPPHRFLQIPRLHHHDPRCHAMQRMAAPRNPLSASWRLAKARVRVVWSSCHHTAVVCNS